MYDSTDSKPADENPLEPRTGMRLEMDFESEALTAMSKIEILILQSHENEASPDHEVTRNRG